MRHVRQLAALAVALALVATLPLVCLCDARGSSTRPVRTAHDCCAPKAGVRAVDEGCCGGSAATVPDSLAAAAPSAPPPPAVAVLAFVAPTLAPARLAAGRAPLVVPASPPSVLRI